MEKPIKKFKKLIFYAFTYNRRKKSEKSDQNYKKILKNKEIAIQ